MIVHKEMAHPGVHSAIVDADLFDAVQRSLDGNARTHEGRSGRVATAPLCGRIFDNDGNPMSPSFSHGATGKVYRYYVSAPLQQGRRAVPQDEAIRRVPAGAIEKLLSAILERLLTSEPGQGLAPITRVEIRASSLQLLLPLKLLATIRGRLAQGEMAEKDCSDISSLRLTIPLRMPIRGGNSWVAQSSSPAARDDPALIKALRSAHRLVTMDRGGLPQIAAAPSSPYLRKLVRLAFLAPDIQQAILLGRQPEGLTLEQLMQSAVPARWSEQRRQIGI